jgi:hypothetical protein
MPLPLFLALFLAISSVFSKGEPTFSCAELKKDKSKKLVVNKSTLKSFEKDETTNY